MYYIAVFVTIFLRLIFHSFEPYPYSYPYPIILTMKIYQSVVLRVVQLFPVSSLFPSSLSLKSASDFAHPDLLKRLKVLVIQLRLIS